MERLNLNEPEAATAAETVPNADEPPALIDVAFEHGLYDMPVLVASLIGALVALIVLVVFVSTFSGLARPVAVAIAVAPVVVVFFALLLAARREGLRKLRKHLAESSDSDLRSRITKLPPMARSLFTQTLMKEVARTLATEGRAGITIRIAPGSSMNAIDPFMVPFEPRRFDELAEAHAGVAPESASDGDSAAGLRHTRPTSTTGVPRGLRRNLILKGGWILFALLGISWVARGIESIQRWTVTPQFMLMTFVMLAFVLVPVQHGWRVGRQWLAVPGGVILRKGAWLKRRWSLHLFDRRESVLVLYKHYRKQWVLVIADRASCEATVGTREELELALSAWLSPLPPPPIEQMSDLS
jgi:hypothetical protein